MAATDLPEGTDIIIEDGIEVGDDSPPAATSRGASVRDSLKTGTDKIKGVANDRALGLLGQGIEKSSGALTNISALVGDTAANLDERLGQEYGDYARSAAASIEKAASSLAAKQPDELFDDARSFVRKSPGIALAGAAILGFALVRVVKSGLDTDTSARKR